MSAVLNSLSDIITLSNKDKLSGSLLDRPYLFRGLADSTYKLLPSITRFCPEIQQIYDSSKQNERHNKIIETIEAQIIKHYFDNAYSKFNFLPQNCKWSLFSHAQHHGVPTRLMDWTTDILSALYFVTSDETKYKVDGSLYMLS